MPADLPQFQTVWNRIKKRLETPEVFDVGDGKHRFHAWFEPSCDDRPEALWTKPLQGKKQPRLRHSVDAFEQIYDAYRQEPHINPISYKRSGLRGHYLFTIIQHCGLSEEAYDER